MSLWLRRLAINSTRRLKIRRPRLGLTALENKVVPSTFMVNIDTDENDGYLVGNKSLREAFVAAAADATTGPHLIQFDSTNGKFLSATTITLTNGELVAGKGGITMTSPVGVPITLKQTTAARVLKIDNGTTAFDSYSITGFAITGGNGSDTAASGRGGGIGVGTESVTLTDCTITANTCVAGGGGIAPFTTAAGVNVSLVNCVVTDNVVTGVSNDGGGFRFTTGQILSITNSTISGNVAGDDGGGIYTYKSGGLTVVNSTISNNRANGADGSGGGVSMANAATGAVSFTNCTIAQNFAQEHGGGVRMSATLTSIGDIAFNYCTISGNSANVAGGGLMREVTNNSGMSVLLYGTVIAGNTAPTFNDIVMLAPGTLNVDLAAIGSRDGYLISSGTLAVAPGTPLLLGIPSDNGGAMLTQRVVPGSPLIDAGGTPVAPTTDQLGNNRILGAAADIGAVEIVSSAPVAVLAAPLPTVDRIGGPNLSVTVTYYDDVAVSHASIDATDLVIAGKTGATVSVANISTVGNAAAITVTYTITAPGGSWDNADNGTLTVSLAAGAVTDAASNPIAAGRLGTVVVNLGNTFTVTNTSGSGTGSLAKAITDALATTINQVDLITFDLTFFNVPRTITLASAITITDAMYFDGPGRDLLTVKAPASARLFSINDGTNGARDVTFAGMTFTGGAPATLAGGALRIVSEFVTLRNMRITGNQASDNGGGVGLSTGIGARLVVIDSEITNNTTLGTSSHGGGIGTGTDSLSIDNSIQIYNSLIANNVAAGGGGALYATSAAVLVDGSLVINNRQTASSGAVGGGAFFLVSPNASADNARFVTIRNSTVTGNTAVSAVAGAGGGGAIATDANFVGTVRLLNSTIASNSAGVKGGAISRLGSFGAFTLQNTIVDGNVAPANPDIFGFVDSTNSLISNSSGASINDLGGTVFDVSALLTPLYGFGGPQRALATLPTSPARETGALNDLTTDQRGPGFPRVIGAVDMGALEFALGTPMATISALPNVATADTSYTFTVRYYDEVAINKASIDGDEIRVTGPNGYDVLASIINTSGTNTQYDVTYAITPPGGAWSFSANGAYTVSLVAGKAQNTGAASVPAIDFGSFNVGLTLNLIVTTDANSGPGSLRQVISDANALSGPAGVTFDTTYFATPRTITLTSGEILVANDITLTNAAAAKVTISGNQTSRIFNVFNSAKAITLEASKLVLRDGRLSQGNDGGAAIFNNGETVKMTNVDFLNNRSAGNAGAIYSQGGTQFLTDVTAIGNEANGTGGDGGFLFANISGITTIVRAVISGNYAFDGGGAMYIAGTSSVTLDRCTVSGNVADGTTTASGGAFYLASGGSMSATNSTISGNTAGRSGGGIRFNNSPLLLVNCTIVGNVARNTGSSGGGGGIYRASGGSGELTLTNTVVADNIAFNTSVGQDINAGSVIVNDSAVFDGSSWALTSGALAVPSGTPLLLGPLADNGGGFLTHLPAPTSPLRNAGSATGVTIDQRGIARPIGANLDIGAVEADGTEPVAVITPLFDVTAAGGTNYQIKVTYYDDIGIDTTKLDGNDLTVAGPNGNIAVSFLGQITVAGGIEADYEFTAPGGTWDGPDAGVYAVKLNLNEVRDTGGVAITPATLGRFKVQLARNYVVTNTNDAGPGSLRQAITDANAIQGFDGIDTVTFDAGVFAAASTITLTSNHIFITDSLTLTGTGTKLLTIAGGGLNRHFAIYGPGTLQVEISNLTLTGGKLTGADTSVDSGASLYIRDEAVVVRQVAFTNNKAAVNGGAVMVLVSGANVTFDSCLFSGNTANNGAAIRLSEGGVTVDVRNSTISGNTATQGGGGISNNGGALTIENSTLAYNTAGAGSAGGGLRHIAGTAILQSVIAAYNSAGTGPDVSGAVAMTADFSIFGKGAGSNATGTSLLLDVDPRLDPLADNGGLTLTHALKADSPAINAGSNSLGLPFDQRGSGFAREFPAGLPDIGAYERLVVSLPPRVLSVTVNNSATQRSRVTTVEATFDQIVTLTGGVTAAFQLVHVVGPANTPDATVTLDGATSTIDNTGAGTKVTLRFAAGPSVDGVAGNFSLADGRYVLSALAANIGNANGALDGDNNGVGGDNFASPSAASVPPSTPPTGIFRLFGDADGNGTVNGTDFLAFRLAFLGTSATFDFDGSGQVNGADFLQFRLRFLQSV